ncbi:hypothetical protein Q5P01_010986 [Channa striata]|uniref:Uncharacterized protein n=1 Tax=Channa striata TaxID=64152 RepID=A0AA88MWN6_CHASR|nr:hypothetical protein Q5P01_010986 [Channa striata]
MASASDFLCEDQFMCSICLDVFTEPVSIPCGHNFCKACITRHWEGREQCQCPLCNSKFNKGLNVCINTAFREIVENFKKHSQETTRENTGLLVKPGQVACDCCLERKIKASKTCLVCLTSFCEQHLEPHRRVDALKRHQLTEPVLNLEDKICRTHNRVLELFCRSDLACICVLCTDHSDHDTVPLEKAYVNKKAHTGKKKASRKRVQKTKAPARTVKKDKSDGTADSAASRQTQATHIMWFPSEGTQAFNEYCYVPRNRGFSEDGSWYEIHLNSKSTWDLGIVKQSSHGDSSLLPIHENGMGIFRLEGRSRSRALQTNPVHLYIVKKPERILVFVECESELVSFYDPYLKIPVYHLTGSKINGGILLFLFPFPTGSWAKRLQNKVQKIKECLQCSDNFFFLAFMACAFLFLIFSDPPK